MSTKRTGALLIKQISSTVVLLFLMAGLTACDNIQQCCCLNSDQGNKLLDPDACSAHHGTCVNSDQCKSSSLLQNRRDGDTLESRIESELRAFQTADTSNADGSRTVEIDMRSLVDNAGLSDQSERSILLSPTYGAAPVILKREGEDGQQPPIVIPGADYSLSIASIKLQLTKAINNKSSLSVSSIVDALPSNPSPSNLAAIEQLKKRGTISFTPDTAINDGNPMEIHLEDQRVGDIVLSVPARTKADVSKVNGGIRFTLDQPITVIMEGLNLKYKVPSNESLKFVEIRPEAVEYRFMSKAGDEISLIVDLKKQR